MGDKTFIRGEGQAGTSPILYPNKKRSIIAVDAQAKILSLLLADWTKIRHVRDNASSTTFLKKLKQNIDHEFYFKSHLQVICVMKQSLINDAHFNIFHD